MNIHELPAATPDSENDALAFDTGTASYKAPFSAFEAGGNNVEFTSDDSETPESWQGIPQVVSGTIATQMRRISRIAANLRYLFAKVGNTALNTTAQTVTAAINELTSGKADKASPTLTGTPKAPTAESGTSNTQIANTRFVADAISAFGTRVTATTSADKNIPTATGTAITSVTLTAGTWILLGKVRFSADANGIRRLNIGQTSGANSIQVQGPPTGGSTTTDMQVTAIVKATGDATTYYLNAYQTSGSTLTCPSGFGDLIAVQVG